MLYHLTKISFLGNINYMPTSISRSHHVTKAATSLRKGIQIHGVVATTLIKEYDLKAAPP